MKIAYFISLNQDNPDYSYDDMLAMSIESAKLEFPDAEIIILTDHVTKLQHSDKLADRVLRTKFESDNPFTQLKYVRLACMMNYFHSEKERETTIFLDPDIVITPGAKSLTCLLLKGSGNLFFTTRYDSTLKQKYREDIVNAGVIIARPLGVASDQYPTIFSFLPHEVFMGRCIKIMNDFTPDQISWAGDQKAMTKALMLNEQNANYYHGVELSDNIHAKFLPVDRWNFTPEEPPQGVLWTKPFVHFKGWRKKWMQDYFNMVKNEAEIG